MEELTPNEQQTLLSIARNAIESCIRRQEATWTVPDSQRLHSPRGCFVTIKQQGQLRGCLGHFHPQHGTLYAEVANLAISAATQDPRFYPMQEQDLADFTVEISVLSPLEPTSDIDSIEVGTHGIYIEKGPHHGVLLPQVATQFGWDRRTFLEQTCRKAGLPGDAWQQPDATIYTFCAQVFGEDEN